MLPTAHRLRRRRDFTMATRRGHRAGSTTLVGHLAIVTPTEPDCPAAHTAARVGFVVGGAVGPAVVRNRVRRRLRHLSVDHLLRLPTGSLLVLRALPAAAGATSAQLARDVAAVLERLMRAQAGAPT